MKVNCVLATALLFAASFAAVVAAETAVAEMRERDELDATRATAPMKPAPDALILDTTTLSAPEVLEAALANVNLKLGVAGE